jgi:FtsP/CotA-like multicopper oxidase with cupredoxin domain
MQHGQRPTSKAITLACFAVAVCGTAAAVAVGSASTAAAQVAAREARPAHAAGKVHTYFIAAEEIDWDYAPSGRDDMMGHAFMDEARIFVERENGRIGRVHRKAIYVEYTGPDFKVRKPRAAEWKHTGILGPVLRAEVGDTIRVVFKNNASRDYSVHAHGVFYRKDSEGAPGNDGTPEADRRDDAVKPGDAWTYVWPVPERAGPGPRDSNSIVWLYHSHTDRVKDTNAGLIGAMIIARKGETAESGRPKGIDREFITLWKIFDENKSWYVEADTKHAGGNYAQLRKDDDFKESNKKHAVKGFIFGNVPMMSMRVGERVRWYVIGLGSEPDIHTAHWHGNTVLHEGRRKDVVSVLPAEHVQIDMVPDNPGVWLLHCHVDDHLEAGMGARYEVLPRTR